MAFNPNLLIKLQPDSLFTDPATIPNITAQTAVPQYWLYNSGSDTSATVLTNGYFDYFANWQNTLQYNDGQYFRSGDAIYCVCEDINVTIYVSSVANGLVETIALPVGPLSVTTGDIVNQAVTAAKIANNTITATQIANGTITTTQISNTAAIIGTQLAASAAILGSQLSATAGIVGTQLANNTLSATQLATSVPQNISVPITSANFKTAFTAGLACIAAPGAGLAIVVDSVTYSFNYLTAAYTAGGAIGLQYSTAAPVNANGFAACATVAAATVTGLSAAGYITEAGSLAIATAAQFVNQGLWFTVATQNFASGSGTVTANIMYRVITV